MTVLRGGVLIALLVGIFTAQQPARLSPQQEKIRKDSLNAAMRALLGLKQYEYQLSLLYEMSRLAPTTIEITGICEIRIADYCYGPLNGKLAFGGIGVRPASGRFRPKHFEAQLVKRHDWLIKRYRDSLLKARKTLPEDRWIAAELTWLSLERGNYPGAIDHLLRCKPEDWWCGAVRAYVTEIAGVVTRADSIWTQVLPRMPTIERCSWLDASWVADDAAVAKRLRNANCADKERISERIWWLSDPLYAVDGNERRSSHLTRNVDMLLNANHYRRAAMTPAMVLRSESPPPDSGMLYAIRPDIQMKYAPWTLTRYSWGYDEVVYRLGPPHFTGGTDDGILVQYPHPRISFVPKGRVFENHLKARADDWNVNNPRAFEFMVAWPSRMRDVDFQIGWFKRGDSSRVVVAADASADSLLRSLKMEPVLFFQRDFDLPRRRFTGIGGSGGSGGSGGPLYRYAFNSTNDSTLASMELLSKGVFGRARFATGHQRGTGPLSISDILLLQPAEVLPRNLGEAEQSALGRTWLVENSAIGIFWEEYGLSAGDRPSIEVVATRERTASVGRIIADIIGNTPSDSLVIRFQESAASGAAIEPRYLGVSLSGLGAGTYMLSLALTLPGRERIVTRREITIRR